MGAPRIRPALLAALGLAISVVTVEPALAAGPLNARLTLDKRAVAKTLGRPGGRLSLETRNGTQVTLTIPRGALEQRRTVRMRLIRRISRTPLRTLVAAVELQPEGLLLPKPATLVFRPAHAIPVVRQVPFAAIRRGRDLHLFPPEPERRSLVLKTTHFSEYGLADDRGAQGSDSGSTCTLELGCIRLKSEQAERIAEHQPANRGARAEADLAKIVKYARDNNLPLDSPLLREAIAQAFLKAFEDVATTLTGYLNQPTAEGWADAINPALTLDKELVLFGFDEGFTWTPPPTDNAELASRLAFFQELIKQGVPLALELGYKEAKRRCVTFHEEPMGRVLIRNGYAQMLLFGKDIFEQAVADAEKCRRPCPSPQRMAAVSPSGIAHVLSPNERPARGWKRMCWPLLRYRETIDVQSVEIDNPSPRGVPQQTSRVTASATATITWELADNSVTGPVAEATYRAADSDLTWSKSYSATSQWPDDAFTLPNEAYTETWNGQGSGTVPLRQGAFMTIASGTLREAALSGSFVAFIDPDWTRATYTVHYWSSLPHIEPRDETLQFAWPIDTNPLIVRDDADAGSYGLSASGTQTMKLPFPDAPTTTVTWQIKVPD